MFIYLVSNDSNALVQTCSTLAQAEAVVLKHGNANWTIELEEAC
jgi:hypothetical protein